MNADPTFEAQRPRLFSLAYRLLGTPADAEDVVQEAWLRWHGADRAAIRDPEAWLVTAATRLGLDRLRAAKASRTDYVGPWLPEPLSVDTATDPAHAGEIASEVSLAFLAVLERLNPDERAAFLLKEAFDYDYARIGEWLGHSEANCRQLVHRARERLRAGRPRFDVSPERHRRVAGRRRTPGLRRRRQGHRCAASLDRRSAHRPAVLGGRPARCGRGRATGLCQR